MTAPDADVSQRPTGTFTRLPFELLNGRAQVPAHELRVPVDSVQGARHDVLLCRVDAPGKGNHPIRHRPRLGRWPPRGLHHFVDHPAKEEGIGPLDVLGRVTMQFFIRNPRTMIAAPVQCDVDGVPKRSHEIESTADCGFWPFSKSSPCSATKTVARVTEGARARASPLNSASPRRALEAGRVRDRSS